MSDVRFDISFAKNNYLAYTQQRSVLLPLLLKINLKKNAAFGISRLMRRWRNRLRVLREHGWKTMESPIRYQFTRNCPPTMCYTLGDQRYQRCGLSQLCPWCYSLETKEVFDKFSMLLPKRGKLSKPYKLIEIRRTHLLSANDKDSLSLVLHKLMDTPRRAIRALQPLGGFYKAQIAPSAKDRFTGQWEAFWRVLVVVDEKYELPDKLLKAKSDIKVSNVFSKRDLIRPISRICRYPTGLFVGDPDMTIDALNSRIGMRSKAFVGCLYGKNVKKIKKLKEEMSDEHTHATEDG